MIDFQNAVLYREPFPHAVINPALDADLFAELASTFPICPPASGPTGHTIHRGDDVFDDLIAGSTAWKSLFDWCNSPEFLNRMCALFADEIARSCFLKCEDFVHVDRVETRTEKELSKLANPDRQPHELFTRFDFMQGMQSYDRAPHLDHRRRLATLLIYFDGPGPDTFDGGELILHDCQGKAISSISPAANVAAAFPCSESSWHSVRGITRCERPRRFVQISVTSCHEIWPAAQLPAKSLFERGKRMLRALVDQQAGQVTRS